MESKNEETRANGVEEPAVGTIKETDAAAVTPEESAYQKANALLASGAYYSAQEAFRALGGYKQSRELAEQCGEHIRELAQRHEDSLKEAQAQQKERDKAARKKKKRKAFIRKWLLPAAAVLAAVLAVTGGILLFLRQKRENAPYAAVEELLAQGSFEKAASEAKKLPEGKKKTKLMTGIFREKAADQAARGLYEEAASTLESLYSAEDIRLVSEYRYKAAAALYEAGQYEKAETAFARLGDYSDSAERAVNCRKIINESGYSAAKALYEDGQYEKAEAAFAKLGDYSDSVAQAENCRKKKTERNYNAAKALYEAGKYEEAEAAFKALGKYSDSATLAADCRDILNERDYNAAKALYEAGQYEKAKAAFKTLGKYGDSAAQVKNCEKAIKENNYEAAKDLLASGKYEEAYAMFTALKGYKDVDTLLATDQGLKEAAIVELDAAWQPGSLVTFGNYTNSIKLEWFVLARNGNKALLLTAKGLYIKPYNKECTDVTWEQCTLRSWLNGEFCKNSFSPAEQARIQLTTVDNSKAQGVPGWNTDGGSDTRDKIFLLSYAEAEKYLRVTRNKTTETRKCWLRSPGYYQDQAACVSYSGSILRRDAAIVDNDKIIVCPALWVDIIDPEQKDDVYLLAKALYEAGQYEKAKAAFKVLGNYNDSAAQVKNCEKAINERDYSAAKALYEDGQYEKALTTFKALWNYNDSAAQVKNCEKAIKENNYEAAKDLLASGKYEEAYAMFTALKGYKDVDTLLATDQGLKEAAIAELDAAWQPGSYVTFGAYEQDNDRKNGKEPVEWLILERNGNKVLLLSRYALDCKPYNASAGKITWEDCTLRTWLNGEFYTGCLSSEEQARIQTAAVTADRNPDYGTDPGNDTQDEVFLLSVQEADKYLGSDNGRRCALTAFAKAQGGRSFSNTAGGAGTCYWWLRSPGCSGSYAARIRESGAIDSNGYDACNTLTTVRPALWVEIF